MLAKVNFEVFGERGQAAKGELRFIGLALKMSDKQQETTDAIQTAGEKHVPETSHVNSLDLAMLRRSNSYD